MLSRQFIIAQTSLLALAAGAWWLAESLFPKEESETASSKGPVDYYSEHVRRVEYDETGKPRRTLVADLMTHYQQDDRTELEKPVMTLFRKDNSPPWIIDSDTATTLGSSDDIFLHGDVVITKKDAKGDELKIITREVKYSPPKDYAETKEDVLMLAPHDELSGTGMQAHLEPNLVLKVLANVRRKHDPH